MILDYATAIRMKQGCLYSQSLLEIKDIYLAKNGWISKEKLHDFLKQNPKTIRVLNNAGPLVLPATSIYGEKYVKSSPNDSVKDNLLYLPRR